MFDFIVDLLFGSRKKKEVIIKEVEVVKEVPVEIIKEVKVEVPKEVIKEVPVEVVKEVPVEVEVIKEVPVEVIKEVVKIVETPEKPKIVLQFLFYDINENLESISIHCESKDEARAMCRQVFMKNAEILLEEPISTMEMETELINAELNKENNFNYCGVKRMQAIISEGTIVDAEGKSIDDVINKLYE